ncbi:EAL domain-containing protein [uncultured Enterovirga sp.]|uniref:EAL domain-containing protein n=1 Tax=uncultured Enterovirga sp. TaxID=2026352 RepID=UPI0035C9ACDC
MVTPGSAEQASLPASSTAPRDPRRILTSIGVVVYDWDLVSDRIIWGANAAEVFGLPEGSLWSTGQDFATAIEPTDGATPAEVIADARLPDEGSGVPYASLYEVRFGPDRNVTVDDTGRWFADADGKPATAHGLMRLRRAQPETQPTGQVRTAFLGQSEADIADALSAKRALTMFAISVGNLSELNDQLGFEAADRAIGTVLARMCATMRGRDRFVRYSGNRFALTLRGCGQTEAEIAAERLCRLVAGEPVATARGVAPIRLVIGAATAPDHAAEAGTLLRRAETSLALAKRRVGTTFLMYDPRLFRIASRSGRSEPLLTGIETLNTRRIALACQPVVEADTRRVAFFEALLRIQGEDGRIRPAGDIVPALERAGLVHLADARMLELVADHLASNPDARVALNVSPTTMERPDWLPILAGHLGSRSGIASRLIVELTETAAIRDPATTRRNLEAMKSLGVSIAIDDFGAGHTSFRHMRDFPVDMVKIDGAFVQNLARSGDDRYFVRTLIDLARHLGLSTVGEWVEDEESALLLAEWGADYLQGDHCGRPVLIAEEPAGEGPPASLVA